MVKRKIKVDYPFYKIVGDGGMSLPQIGEGRFIPSIIIDIADNVEIAELIKLHKVTLPGDVELIWSLPATFFKPTSVYLNLTFLRPMRIQFGVDFHLENQYAIVDGIIQSRAFYLQVGKKGDKISQFKNENILIEVPNLAFDKKWNELLLETVKNNYRKKYNVSKFEASALANEEIKKMREIWNIRRE